MSVPDGLPPLSHVIRDLGLSARRSLSQNFLLDFNLTRRIARAAGPLDQATIVEVGPGPGGLTRALLLEGAARVVAIESDREFGLSVLQRVDEELKRRGKALLYTTHYMEEIERLADRVWRVPLDGRSPRELITDRIALPDIDVGFAALAVSGIAYAAGINPTGACGGG